jgi:hypothetical protein
VNRLLAASRNRFRQLVYVKGFVSCRINNRGWGSDRGAFANGVYGGLASKAVGASPAELQKILSS